MVPKRPSLRDQLPPSAGANLTPFVGVLMCVLFFFLFASKPTDTTPSISLTLPALDDVLASRAAIPHSSVLITIARDGVYLDTERLADADLATRLADRLKILDRTRVTDAMIRFDPKASSGTLMVVIGACQEAAFSHPMLVPDESPSSP